MVIHFIGIPPFPCRSHIRSFLSVIWQKKYTMNERTNFFVGISATQTEINKSKWIWAICIDSEIYCNKIGFFISSEIGWWWQWLLLPISHSIKKFACILFVGIVHNVKYMVHTPHSAREEKNSIYMCKVRQQNNDDRSKKNENEILWLIYITSFSL